MMPLESFLPAPNADALPPMQAPQVNDSATKAAAPFDEMMSRELAKPERKPDPKNSIVKKPGTTPGTVRKLKPAVDESNANAPLPAPQPAVVLAAESPNKPGKNSSAQHSESPASAADEKSAAKTPANSNPEMPGLNLLSPLQMLAASLAVDQNNQSQVVSPGVSKTASAGAQTAIAAIAASKGRSEIGLVAGPETSEKSAKTVNSDSKSAAKNPTDTGKKVSLAVIDPEKKSTLDGGALSLKALSDKAADHQETPANKANPASAKPIAPGLDAAGTAGAQQPGTMQNTDHPGKVAEPPDQSLAGVTVVASAAEAAAHAKPVAKAKRAESSEVGATASATTVDRAPMTAETSSSNLISASSQTELRIRAMDRTHDMVALHGMQLKQAGTDSLQVVIKPGAGVQLSLQMKQTSDGIEAQAVLQQGSFHDLNKHWGELQQRLEERGIKLAPLGQDSSAANNGGENFQRPSHQSNEQNPLSAGAFAEFASAGAAASAPAAAAAVTGKGWEGWA